MCLLPYRVGEHEETECELCGSTPAYNAIDGRTEVINDERGSVYAYETFYVCDRCAARCER